MLKRHTLVPECTFEKIRYELRPAIDPAGRPAEGLYNAWIVASNAIALLRRSSVLASVKPITSSVEA